MKFEKLMEFTWAHLKTKLPLWMISLLIFLSLILTAALTYVLGNFQMSRAFANFAFCMLILVTLVQLAKPSKEESSKDSKIKQRSRRQSLLMLTIFIIFAILITVFGWRDLLYVGQFGFSNVMALERNKWFYELQVGLNAWAPYGHVPPEPIASFYGYESLARSGLGGFNPTHNRAFYNAAIYFLFELISGENPTFVQRAYLMMWMPISGISAYLLLRKLGIGYFPSGFGAFFYMVNPETIQGTVSQSQTFLPMYSLIPLLYLTSIGYLNGDSDKKVKLASACLISGIIASFYFFPISLLFLLYLILAYIIVNRNRIILTRSIKLWISVTIATMLLTMPQTLLLFEELTKKTVEQMATSVWSGYNIEAQLIGMRDWMFRTAQPSNFFTISMGVNVPSWWYGGTDPFNAIGFVIPIFAFLALFNRKNPKHKIALTFTVLVLLTIIWPWATGAGLTFPLYRAFPALIMFNTAEFFVWIVLVGFSVLIALSLESFLSHISKLVDLLVKNVDRADVIQKLRKMMSAIIIMFTLMALLVAYNWPLFTGDWALSRQPMGMTINNPYPYMPSVFYEMNDWLIKNDKRLLDYRVLLLPPSIASVYFRDVISPNVLNPPKYLVEILVRNETTRIGALLGFFNVKYIFLNYVIHEGSYSVDGLESSLNRQEDLIRVFKNKDFAVYKNIRWVPIITISDKLFYVWTEKNFSSVDTLRVLSTLPPNFNATAYPLVFLNSTLDNEKENFKDLQASLFIIGISDSETLTSMLNSHNFSEIVQILHLPSIVSKKIDTVRFNAKLQGITDKGVLYSTYSFGKLPSQILQGNFSEISFSVWVHPVSEIYGGTGTIFSNEAPAYGGPTRWNPGDAFFTSAGGVKFPKIPTKRWSHLAMVFNGTHLAGYVNGKLVSVLKTDVNKLMLKGDSYIAANYYQNGSFLDGYIRNFEIYNRSLSNVTAEEDILIFWPLEGKSWEECIYKGSKISCSLIGNVSKELVAPALEREAASALGNVLSLETSFHIKLNAPVSGRFQVLLKAGPNGNFKVNNISLIPELSFKSFSWYKGVISLQEGLNDLLLEVDEGSSLDLLVISLKGNFSNIAKKSAQYSFKLVSYTNYELTVNNSGPVYVVLGQTFHPGWQLIHGNGKVNSFNVNLWANGFVFEGQGFRKATIYFGPQHLHVTGIAIWAITCLFLMGVILYSYLRRLRLRLDSVRALKKRIRDYWNRWPCVAPQELKKHTEDKKPIYRYKMQPFIPAFAKFSNYKGKRVLEIGLGAGTDFIQFKNSNVESIGIDISMVSLKICKRRLKLYGLDADIICADGENMPFRNGVFDMVYSYGVIHHCPFPEKVVDEIYRTLKNGGELKVMIYHRPSLAALRKYLVAILKGRWRRSVNAVISEVLESKGTRTYTIGEARNLFKKFKNLKMQPTLVFYDLMIFGHPPPWFLQKILNRLGWFLHIYAIK